jgi:hypothetical protein
MDTTSGKVDIQPIRNLIPSVLKDVGADSHLGTAMSGHEHDKVTMTRPQINIWKYYASSMSISCFKEAKIENTYILSTSPLYQVTGIHKTLWASVMVSVAGLGFQPN